MFYLKYITAIYIFVHFLAHLFNDACTFFLSALIFISVLSHLLFGQHVHLFGASCINFPFTIYTVNVINGCD